MPRTGTVTGQRPDDGIDPTADARDRNRTDPDGLTGSSSAGWPRPTPYAAFTGADGGTAPLTWGQREMFRAAPGPAVNPRRVFSVPARWQTSVPAAVGAIGALVSRHSALRTLVAPVDGRLRQVVAGEGRIPVRVCPVGPADGDPDGHRTARTLAGRLAEPIFDHAGELPLRAALVTVDQLVRQIVLVFNHSTVDFQATEVLLRDLRMILLRGAAPGRPGLQPAAVARREQDAEQGRSDRAVAWWVRQFRELPAGPFAGPRAAGPVTGAPGSTDGARYQSGALTSVAVREAIRSIAATHRVGTAAVLLAAIADRLTAGDGPRVAGIMLMSGNRHPPGYDNAVASLCQLGLCRLDLSDRPGLTQALPRTQRATLDAYRHAYYDPVAWKRAFRRFDIDIETALAPYCYVNDARLPDGMAPGVPGPDPGTLRAALARSAFAWLSPPKPFGWRCRIQVLDAPGAVRLVTTVDTHYLPLDRAERMLWEVEEVLVSAATEAVELSSGL